MREISVQIKNKAHRDKQLSDLYLMMYIHITFIEIFHATELFKIFFSLLTLSTAFLQKAGGPGKMASEYSRRVYKSKRKKQQDQEPTGKTERATIESDEKNVIN